MVMITKQLRKKILQVLMEEQDGTLDHGNNLEHQK